MNKKRCTIVDIASMVGFSVATCSRVLSGSDYPVKESTKKAIFEAAKELDYKPNQFSRMLKGKINYHIGVLVPSIRNPFYSAILDSIQIRSLEHNFIPIICSSSGNVGLECRFIDLFLEEQVSGIMLSSVDESGQTIKKIEDSNIPFVLFDQMLPGFDGDYVGFDFFQAGKVAVDFLNKCGHMNFVIATGQIDRNSRIQYIKGCKDEANLKGMEYEVIIGSGDDDYSVGTSIALDILSLKSLPSAVISINDIIALGVMYKLQEEGLVIPRDISIMGFDDIPYSRMVYPSLTTIKQNTFKTGSEATEILINKIKNNETMKKQIIFQPELIVRESIKKS